MEDFTSSSSSSSDANGEKKPKKKKPEVNLKARRGNINSSEYLKELLEKHEQKIGVESENSPP